MSELKEAHTTTLKNGIMSKGYGELIWLRELLETRLDGMDKAIELLQKTTDQFPAFVDMKVAHLQELDNEKFRSIQVQFQERDTRTDQTSKDSKVAVDAALQAAKEAVEKQNTSSALSIAKSESATMKQIDQQGALLSTATGGLDGKISDLKDRVTVIEGRGSGREAAIEQHHTENETTQWMIGITVAILLGVASLGLAIFAAVKQ